MVVLDASTKYNNLEKIEKINLFKYLYIYTFKFYYMEKEFNQNLSLINAVIDNNHVIRENLLNNGVDTEVTLHGKTALIIAVENNIQEIINLDLFRRFQALINVANENDIPEEVIIEILNY